MFHPQNLLLRISIVGNVDEFPNFRRIDLFVFPTEWRANLFLDNFNSKSMLRAIGHLRCNEHTSRSNELQFGSLDRHDTEKPVYVIHPEVNGFLLQLVLLTNFNQPIDKNTPHCESNVWLFGHVITLSHMLQLQ